MSRLAYEGFGPEEFVSTPNAGKSFNTEHTEKRRARRIPLHTESFFCLRNDYPAGHERVGLTVVGELSGGGEGLGEAVAGGEQG